MYSSMTAGYTILPVEPHSKSFFVFVVFVLIEAGGRIGY